jgi:leucyl-tRNA synthetase
MIAVNELTDLQCEAREVLLPLAILLQPYAPHITEELYSLLVPGESLNTSGPGINGTLYRSLIRNFYRRIRRVYPVAVDGKTRTQLELPLSISPAEVEAIVVADPVVVKWL